MKIIANDIDLKDAKRFDSFPGVIFNCKIEYNCFKKAEQYCYLYIYCFYSSFALVENRWRQKLEIGLF